MLYSRCILRAHIKIIIIGKIDIKEIKARWITYIKKWKLLVRDNINYNDNYVVNGELYVNWFALFTRISLDISMEWSKLVLKNVMVMIRDKLNLNI